MSEVESTSTFPSRRNGAMASTGSQGRARPKSGDSRLPLSDLSLGEGLAASQSDTRGDRATSTPSTLQTGSRVDPSTARPNVDTRFGPSPGPQCIAGDLSGQQHVDDTGIEGARPVKHKISISNGGDVLVCTGGDLTRQGVKIARSEVPVCDPGSTPSTKENQDPGPAQLARTGVGNKRRPLGSQERQSSRSQAPPKKKLKDTGVGPETKTAPHEHGRGSKREAANSGRPGDETAPDEEDEGLESGTFESRLHLLLARLGNDTHGGIKIHCDGSSYTPLRLSPMDRKHLQNEVMDIYRLSVPSDSLAQTTDLHRKDVPRCNRKGTSWPGAATRLGSEGISGGTLAQSVQPEAPSLVPADGLALSDEELCTMFANAPLVSYFKWSAYRKPTRPQGALSDEGRSQENQLWKKVMKAIHGPYWATKSGGRSLLNEDVRWRRLLVERV
jgi:hypothetical protein